MMSKVDWSKAPEWATCVVVPSHGKFNTEYHWSEKPKMYARMMNLETKNEYVMSFSDFWQIVAERPLQPINDVKPVQTKLMMTPKAGNNTYEQFIANGWDDDQLVENGYATWVNDDSPVPRTTLAASINDDRLNNDLWKSAMNVGQTNMSDSINCRCTFTPVEQPSTAPDLLKEAEQLLIERGQQYDKSGNERSAAKIVAAFNAVTGRDLTPGEGWLFLVMLKAVRFYSNTETPHRDSLEDMIAYAALHAEEYLNDK